MNDPITVTDIRTYVVNLRRRTDRRERMARVLPPELPATFTSDWDGPFDGRDLNRVKLEAAGYRMFPWPIESDNPWWNRPLKLGEIGCTLNHHACWQDAVTRCEPYALILEDDIVLEDGFAERCVGGLRRLAGRHVYDLLYLGRSPLQPDIEVAPDVVSPGYSHCTFGYLLTRRALKILLAQRLHQALVPVDEFLPAMYIDHPRADLRTRFPRQLAALAFDPPLVRQLPKDEAGSDTENSAFLDE